ncbi:hypothetical protein NVP1261O_31 [Vibrio phage 1.261.O._10N.286.51.A7]|uniref:Uncharacterized protein n=1 Tax=Vibrio phage 1.261.O._10N.286.51.A7 TaxID=1881237 RepID=A0A2I7RZF9_9CAUD|nr:hypothetical protein HOU80_gp71 [Vibrio phage 1.261.O._10N.286.51.A7]AUR99035.1 hypothetical protein NVP1261O_31 [Vibrio phage 1.261.O._10N.286.51.A7]
MYLTPTNWHVSAYTTDEWTDIIIDKAMVATFILSNTTGTPLNVSVQLTDHLGVKLATICPLMTIEHSEVIDVRSLNVLVGQKVQVKADTQGAEFLISGLVEEDLPVAE